MAGGVLAIVGLLALLIAALELIARRVVQAAEPQDRGAPGSWPVVMPWGELNDPVDRLRERGL
jgi:hypothetical protein